MRPSELQSAAVKLFGKRGWIAILAARLGLERTAIWRYTSGAIPVPGPVAAAVKAWVKLAKNGIPLPK